MTANAMNVWGEILGIAVGAGSLLIFGILTALMVRRPSIPPGSKGRREKEAEGTHETIAADGYIDSFAGVIEEGGGSLPPVVLVALITIPLWWLIYMILNWSPHLINIITVNQSTYRP
jgi:hypothetical protein